jgi:hypothetical protein
LNGGSQITKDLLRGVFDQRAESGDLGFFEGDTPAARKFHAVSKGAGVDYNDWLEGSPMMENKAMNEAKATQQLQFEDWKDQQFPLSTGIGSGGTGTYNVGQGGYTNTGGLGGSNTGGLGGSGAGGALGGGGWQPFMTDDEAGQYYGQYAHGGPVALRRKMFSMGGGVDKSHGVGLTSGLTRTVPPQRGPMPQGFRTGGHVVPQRVGYQPANHPHRQGNREGHSGSVWKAIGKGILESINPKIWKEVPGGAVDEAAEAAGKGSKAVDEWAAEADKFVPGGAGPKITKEVFESLPPSLKRKLLRAGMVGGTYGGITSALNSFLFKLGGRDSKTSLVILGPAPPGTNLSASAAHSSTALDPFPAASAASSTAPPGTSFHIFGLIDSSIPFPIAFHTDPECPSLFPCL